GTRGERPVCRPGRQFLERHGKSGHPRSEFKLSKASAKGPDAARRRTCTGDGCRNLEGDHEQLQGERGVVQGRSAIRISDGTSQRSVSTSSAVVLDGKIRIRKIIG